MWENTGFWQVGNNWKSHTWHHVQKRHRNPLMVSLLKLQVQPLSYRWTKAANGGREKKIVVVFLFLLYFCAVSVPPGLREKRTTYEPVPQRIKSKTTSNTKRCVLGKCAVSSFGEHGNADVRCAVQQVAPWIAWSASTNILRVALCRIACRKQCHINVHNNCLFS